MTEQTKNVFISHIHEDDTGLGKVKELLSNHGVNIRDASINSSNPNDAKSPDYIKSEILAPNIKWAGTLVVYVTPGTKNSEWVNWEIEYAHKIGKRIVGVWAHGHNDCELPDALENYGDAVVGWNGASIVDAINGDCDVWEKPGGASYPDRAIKPHNC
ncbi:MAG: TIR domain-containing protein [Erythrobacter sp.]|uniref:TIR domain-containing protein n=1 Tax=Parasphingorhabdus sp. TaxID=2709688 RepID=UPI00328B5044